MRSLLPLLLVLLAAVGVLVCVVFLRYQAGRKRVAAAAERDEQHRLDQEADRRAAELIEQVDRELADGELADGELADGDADAADRNLTRQFPATTLDKVRSAGTRFLNPDLGGPVPSLPPVSAPTTRTAGAPAPPFGPVTAGWATRQPPPAAETIPVVPLDPSESTPVADALTEPEAPNWVTGGFTRIIEHAEFLRYCSLAEFAQMHAEKPDANGAEK